VRKLAIGSAALLAAGMTLPSALAHPTGPSEPSTCGSTDVGLSITPTMLWPPNHKMVPVYITATDRDGDGDMVSVMIGTITNSDETNPPNPQEINGTGQPDTSAMSDQQGSGQSSSFNDPGSHTFTVYLAAERSGHDNGSGRTYSIPVSCTESMGEMGMGNATMKVFVPHDQGNNVSSS
jgi:hypothetical protein